MSESLKIRRPYDMHLHVRDGNRLASVLPHTAAQFAGAIIMPNLRPPVTSILQAEAYLGRIREALPAGDRFRPLMTLYLTDQTTKDDVAAAANHPDVFAYKLYPAGATTNSDAGVTNLESRYEIFGEMAKHDIPLLVHGEVTDADVDVFDREAVFIEKILSKIVARFPSLKICLEHITTKDAAQFVVDQNIHATITAHHLLDNRNAIFYKGINPHLYCLPVLKREVHREALVQAATSDSGHFFLGTDSAPHLQSDKESACGCAGIYTAHAAVELYAAAFENAGALGKFENFASVFGPKFYGIAPSEERIVLKKQPWTLPSSYSFADGRIIPYRGGQTLAWKLGEA